MPYDNAAVQWIQNIKGLNETTPPGSKRHLDTGLDTLSPVTPDMNNVKVRFGNISGRGGMTPYEGLSAVNDGPIIGLFTYNRTNDSANVLASVTSATLRKWDPSADGDWVDVTGAALNGDSLTRPQYTIQNDILVFTMDGLCRPQGYGSNTGVEVNYTTGTTLGGTPPYAKCLTSYMQFLLLGNVSNDGTYTDVFDGWRLIEYSDNPFVSWTACSANTIDLYQTPGSLVAMKPLGRVCMCYKTDGVIRLTWTGGSNKFTQELVPGSVGCVAPLSVVDLGAFGHVYLGVNGVIYHVSQTAIMPVSQEQLSQTMPAALAISDQLRYVRGFVVPSEDIYVMLYNAGQGSANLLDSYITWNYKSGEFAKGNFGWWPTACTSYAQYNDRTATGVLGVETLTSDLVEEYDSSNNTVDDDGGTVYPLNRYWTSGWQKLAEEEGFLFGVIVEARKQRGARIKVSIAREFSTVFTNEQEFDLKTGDPNSAFAECYYRLPSPMFGAWFNVKIRMIHDISPARIEIVRVGFIAQPKHKYPSSPQRTAIGQTNIGSTSDRS